MSKLEEAKEILSSLKVPAKQQNGMCCCVLLAMANLTEAEAWGSATNNWIRIHDVIAFANSNYGTTYPVYQGVQGKIVGSETDALKEQLDKSIDLLELTDWQKQKMHEISIDTIGDLISAPEEKLKQAKYIADVRARTIKNAGIAAVCEYLLG